MSSGDDEPVKKPSKSPMASPIKPSSKPKPTGSPIKKPTPPPPPIRARSLGDLNEKEEIPSSPKQKQKSPVKEPRKNESPVKEPQKHESPVKPKPESPIKPEEKSVKKPKRGRRLSEVDALIQTDRPTNRPRIESIVFDLNPNKKWKKNRGKYVYPRCMVVGTFEITDEHTIKSKGGKEKEEDDKEVVSPKDKKPVVEVFDKVYPVDDVVIMTDSNHSGVNKSTARRNGVNIDFQWNDHEWNPNASEFKGHFALICVKYDGTWSKHWVRSAAYLLNTNGGLLFVPDGKSDEQLQRYNRRKATIKEDVDQYGKQYFTFTEDPKNPNCMLFVRNQTPVEAADESK